MVLVSVRQEDTSDAVLVLKHVRVILDNGVDAEHALFRERDTDIDDDDVVSVLEKRHVLADLLHAAQRDDLELMRFFLAGKCSFRVFYGLQERGVDLGQYFVRCRCKSTLLGFHVAPAAQGLTGLELPGAFRAGNGSAFSGCLRRSGTRRCLSGRDLPGRRGRALSAGFGRRRKSDGVIVFRAFRSALGGRLSIVGLCHIYLSPFTV